MMMSGELFTKYEADPLGMDEEVRRRFGIPDNRYYTVAVFPQHLAGRITVERTRLVKTAKISKSDNP
jgi:hypothetical protein